MNYLLCSVYIWGIFAYYTLLSTFCEDYENSGIFELIKDLVKRIFASKEFPVYVKKFVNSTKNVTANLTVSRAYILNKALYENFLFYLIMCLIAFILSAKTISLFSKRAFKFFKYIFCCESVEKKRPKLMIL